MDTPLLALQGLFGDKAHMVKYLPLSLKPTQGFTILKTTPLATHLFKIFGFSIFLGATRKEILRHGGFWRKTCQSHPSHWALNSIVFQKHAHSENGFSETPDPKA